MLFADTVDALGEDHAGDPTLYGGWDVRTLTGHMLQPILVPSWRFMLTAVRVRSMARACDVIASRLFDQPLIEVSETLRQRAGTPASPGTRAAGPFADSCIHLRDLALPQGLNVTVPPDRWKAVVDIIVSDRGQAAFLPTKELPERSRLAGHGPGPGMGMGCRSPLASRCSGLVGQHGRAGTLGAGYGEHTWPHV